MRSLALILFFFSGAFGLVYQVVWVRLSIQVFGSTAAAVGVVLAAFMSGLALGSWLLGKAADRDPNPLRLYAILELGVGIAALFAHWSLARVTPAYLALYEVAGQSEAVLAALRFALNFAIVLVPTSLMGATLPALARFVLRRTATAGADLALLYAVNTSGAVAGVLAAGFWLIREFGIDVTAYLAVAGNLLLAAAAYAAASRLAAEPAGEIAAPRADSAGESPAADPRWRWLLLALFFSGVTSFAYEIYWTRSLVFVLGNSTYALSAMLTAFISGVALGGFLSRMLVDRTADRVAALGWIQLLIALSAAAALPLLFAAFEPGELRSMLGPAQAEMGLLFGGRFAIALLVMLPPATLIGATFPLVARIGIADLGQSGRRVGLAYAVNTLGNVAGALLPGFVLLNWLGIQRGILLMAAVNALTGLALLGSRLRHAGYLRVALPLAALAATLVMVQVPLDFRFPSENEHAGHRVLYYRDGPTATTKVTLDPATGAREMAIDGIVIGGNTFTEYKQLLLAHLPKLLLEDVSSELTIGLGSGMLAGESLRHPGVRELTCVEIEPSVVAGAAYFSAENHGVLDNPRLDIVIDDIANYLRTRDQRYRVISADEKTSMEYAANGFSYSAEYYALLRRRLAPDGIVIQWVPAGLPPSQYAMVLKTFSNSFPRVLMGLFMPAFKESGYNTILVGSEREIGLDPARIERVMRSERQAFEALAPYGLTTPEAVIAQFVADGETIRAAVRDAQLNTLDHPRYEFYAPRIYAVPLKQRVAANIALIAGLKREAASRLAALIRSGDERQAERLAAAQAAELEFLEGYRVSLGPVDARQIFRRYDAALELAPWNQNLRERIALHYREIADSQASPRVRDYLSGRARAARGDVDRAPPGQTGVDRR